MPVHVLIIDEHKAAREGLARRLAAFPDMFVVDSTGDGEEGLRRMGELRFDVVLLDPKMKKADGMEVCRRACSCFNGAKVIVLTSYADPVERRLASQAGVFDYLLKDVDTPKLARWIKHLADEPRPRAGSAQGAAATGSGSHREGERDEAADPPGSLQVCRRGPEPGGPPGREGGG